MDPDAVDDLGSRGDRERGDGAGDCTSGGRVPHGSAEDPWVVDFSANTNPRSPDGTARVYESAFAASRAYPADDYCEFRATAAEFVGCDGLQVIPTAGGIEAIRLAVATTVTAGDDVVVPAPSFGEYAREVRLQGGEPTFVEPHALMETDPSPYTLAIACQPNNPTGRAYEPGALSKYAERCRDADTVFLVDEAFLEFTDLPSLAGTPGVIVARSLTKLFGLPGLRIGYAVATGQLQERLEVARPAWGVGAPAAAVGAHCLSDDEFAAETRERVRTERDRLQERLSTRFEVTPSVAPFLLLDVGSPEAVDDVIAEARESSIAIRDARTFRGLDQHVRVAVKLRYENDLLLDAFDV